jgi:energy-coupling factor transporter ATP-binding protein EcfA2
MSVVFDLEGYSQRDLRNLQKLLTFTYKNPFGPNTVVKAFLPFGKNKVLVPYAIGRKLQKYEEIAKKTYIDPWKFIQELYENQIPIHEEAISILREKGSIALFIPTGVGKSALATEFAATLIGESGGRVLVLFKNVSLEEGWKTTFETFTDGKVAVVPPNAKSFDYTSYNLLVCRISRIREEFEDDIDVLILDEIHLLETENFLDQILRIRPRYVIILTATDKRDDGMDKIGIALAGGENQQIRIEPKKPYQVFKIDTGFGNHSFPEDMVDEDGLPEPPCDATRIRLETLLAYHEERNERIAEFLIKLSESRFRIIVIGDKVKQIMSLYETLRDNEISVDYMCGKKSTLVNAKICIVGINKGVGFDQATAIKDWDGVRFDLIVLLFVTYKFVQAVGRLRTTASVKIPYIVNLVDKDQKGWFRKTWKANVDWYEAHFDDEKIGKIHPETTWDDVADKLLTM